MATATTTTVTVEKVQTVDEKVYVLTLSEEEAKALLAVTGYIGGATLNSPPRKHTDSIYIALHSKGVRHTHRFKQNNGYFEFVENV